MTNRFYTLLYLDKDEIRSLSKTGVGKASILSYEDRIKVFLGCAALLDKSLKINNVGYLEILTNNKDFLVSLQRKFGYSTIVTEIPFTLDVPKGIKFYSAHYKIDVFKYLGTLDNQMSFLLDNDVVCTSNLPQIISNIENSQYDDRHFPALIYSMPRYFGERMIHDKKLVDEKQIHGLWAGGEFIAGLSTFFQCLYNEVMDVKDSYWSCYKRLFHQGDEMLTSIALENIFYKCKFPLLDAGTLGLVKRYWSILDKNPFYKENVWFVHLPYDKGMLSTIDVDQIKSNDDFVRLYKKYYFKIRIKKVIRKIYLSLHK